nr:DUF2691 family protein [Metasolibacillus meyeri]
MLGNELFSNQAVFNGQAFLEKISAQDYYVIFADLKAFPQKEDIIEIRNGADFLQSNCELALIIIDSSYVYMYVKNEQLLQRLVERVQTCNYQNMQLTVNDHHTLLTVWR